MNKTQELFLCQAIETGLSAQFFHNPELTDGLCIIGLDNAIIALKQHFGFAKNETVLRHAGVDEVVAHVLAVGLDNIDQDNGLTLKEYIGVVTIIKKSVVRHAALGPRAYFNFIKDYV